MNVYKPFSKELYNKYDEKAKSAVSLFLMKHGYAVSSKEDYKADLVASKGAETSHHEVEIKAVWRGEWPKSWKTIHIPYRKSKLASEGDVCFWVLRNDAKKAWFIYLKDVLGSPVVEVSNNKVPLGEKFFDVPIDKCTLINLTNTA